MSKKTILKFIRYGAVFALLSGTIFFVLVAYLNSQAKTLDIESVVMDEPRTVQVFLPAGFGDNPERRYTVLYTLDGERIRNGALAALTARMAAPEPLILVAIDAQGWRRRDMLWDGATRFGKPHARQATRLLSFIETELIPKIESSYPTNGKRLLAGHSLGGLFAIYALTQKPNLFDGYLAFSPTFSHADGSVEKLADFLKTNPELDQFLYMNLGLETADSYRDLFIESEDALKENAPPKLRQSISYYSLPHPFIMMPGYAEGLRNFFEQ